MGGGEVRFGTRGLSGGRGIILFEYLSYTNSWNRTALPGEPEEPEDGGPTIRPKLYDEEDPVVEYELIIGWGGPDEVRPENENTGCDRLLLYRGQEEETLLLLQNTRGLLGLALGSGTDFDPRGEAVTFGVSYHAQFDATGGRHVYRRDNPFAPKHPDSYGTGDSGGYAPICPWYEVYVMPKYGELGDVSRPGLLFEGEGEDPENPLWDGVAVFDLKTGAFYVEIDGVLYKIVDPSKVREDGAFDLGKWNAAEGRYENTEPVDIDESDADELSWLDAVEYALGVVRGLYEAGAEQLEDLADTAKKLFEDPQKFAEDLVKGLKGAIDKLKEADSLEDVLEVLDPELVEFLRSTGLIEGGEEYTMEQRGKALGKFIFGYLPQLAGAGAAALAAKIAKKLKLGSKLKLPDWKAGKLSPEDVSKKATKAAKASIPDDVIDTLKHIKEKGSPKKGLKGGGVFKNREGKLPKFGADGNPITYKEWDIDPEGPNGRNARRIVTGSDGRAYYTDDHYDTFTEILEE